MRPSEETATREFLEALQVVDVDRNIAWQAGELLGDDGRRGITLDFVDTTIAATCVRHRLLLATHNVKRYPIRELRLAQNPASP